MNTSYLQQRLQALHKLHSAPLEGYGDLVKALGEECGIFCETLPQYKINPQMPGEGEGDGDKTARRLKKEVFNVEKLEHELLTQYEHFLELLGRLLKKSHPEQQALGSRMCAQLLPVAREFNHNDKLIWLAIQFANCKATRVAQPAQLALQELLNSESVSEATQHVVSGILSIVRKKKHALNPKLLTLLLSIRVAMIDMHRKDIVEEKARSRMMKKQDKQVAQQMQKAEARVGRAELAAKQTKIVHSLFVIYLRVLEASKYCAKDHQSRILAPTLEGLAKYAPLVSVEHYGLLMQALKELLEDEETSVDTKLHALVAVACLAKKDATLDGSDWRVDLAWFHNILFRCLPEALSMPHPQAGASKEEEADERDETASQGSVGSVGTLSQAAFSIAQSMALHSSTRAQIARMWTLRCEVVIRAVDLLVLTQKHIPPIRIAALLRRIALHAAQCPPNIAMALLCLCHRIAVRHPSVTGLIVGGPDNQQGGRGQFRPDAETIEASGGESSFTWELALLSHSFHPAEATLANTFARHYAKQAKAADASGPLTSHALDRLVPYDVLEKYDASEAVVQPPPPPPRNTTGRTKRPKQTKITNPRLVLHLKRKRSNSKSERPPAPPKREN